MKPTAIVYTSNTGHTKRYAELFNKITGIKLYNLKEASKLEKGTQIIYFGWLFANSIKKYNAVIKRFDVKAVVAVGLCDTGTLIPEVRKVNNIPETISLFTVQGGISKNKLRGINKLMINMLTSSLKKNEQRDDEQNRMLALLKSDNDYVSEENLSQIIKWFELA